MARFFHASYATKLVFLSALFILSSTQRAWPLPAVDILSRPVSDAEIADGAPAGTVFDFYLSSEADPLLLQLKEITGSIYQNEMGYDTKPAPQEFIAVSPSLEVDSWFSMPSETSIAGDGFSLLAGSDTAWFDFENTEATSDFHFGRLTIPKNSPLSIDGAFHMRNPAGPDVYSLSFDVDEDGGHRWYIGTQFRPSYISRVNTTPRPPKDPTPPPPQEPTPTTRDYTRPHWADPLESALFTASSRAVTEAEIAAGAPAGQVFDLFVSTASDILTIAVEDLSVPIFNHALGSDTKVVPQIDDALGVDSWITTPGSTGIAGKGFAFEPHVDKAPSWFDVNSNGPQSDFQFARLTVPENNSGVFEGFISRQNSAGPIYEPFQFLMDESGSWDLLFGADLIPEEPVEEPVVESPPPVQPTEPPPAETEQDGAEPPEPIIPEIDDPEEDDPTLIIDLPIEVDPVEIDVIARIGKPIFLPVETILKLDPMILINDNTRCLTRDCLVATDGPASLPVGFDTKFIDYKVIDLDSQGLTNRRGSSIPLNSFGLLEDGSQASPSHNNLPEPTSLALLVLGLIPLSCGRRRVGRTG